MTLRLRLFPRSDGILDEEGNEVPATGAMFVITAYYETLMRSGDLLTTSPFAASGVPLIIPPVALGTVSVRQFGAVGNGTTDDRPAFLAALATGKAVLVPATDTFYRIVGPLTINAGGLIGDECHQTDSGVWSRLVFEDCDDASSGAINTRQASFLGGQVRLANLFIQAKNWAECEGYGVDAETPIEAVNVSVAGFPRSGIWLHHDATLNGPYQTRLENVFSQYNGGHGCLVGNGANNITLINYEGKWNGAPSYLVQPSLAGTGDGFHVAQTADGGSYPAYTPEGLVVIGGDCSYNAGFGWNLSQVQYSHICPGYCEGNLTNQVRWETLVNTHVQLTQVAGGEAGCTDASFYQPYEWGSKVMLGGKQLWPSTFRDRTLNPTASDVSGATIQNAARRVEFLARNNTASQIVYTTQGLDAEGSELSLADFAVLNFRCTSTAAISLGGNNTGTARYLKITQDGVRLPDQFYWAGGSGWNAAAITCKRHIARATAGPGQSIPDAGATSTPVALSAETFDFAGDMSSATVDGVSTIVFTAPRDGVYAIEAHAALDSNAAGGWFQISVTKNGSPGTAVTEGGRNPANLGGQARSELADKVLLDEGDVCVFRCYQDAATTGAKDIILARWSVHYEWS